MEAPRVKNGRLPSLERIVGGWWPSLTFIVILFFLFKPLWWDGELLGFRDSLHFYYPLWSYMDSLPMAERIIPRWNPLDAFGSSIVGEPTSMVFYPFRAVLHLPIGTIEQRIGFFIILHFIMAFGAWVATGFRFRFDRLSIQLSGMAYVLCGPVFFQIYNPPFLIGATWLPVAMTGLIGIFRFHSCQPTQPKWSTRLVFTNDISIIAFALTMMILGGDAQAAFHFGMIGILVGMAVGMAVGFRCGLNWIRREDFFEVQSVLPLGKLLFSLLFAAGLSAVQIVPTCYWLRHSERVAPASQSDYKTDITLTPLDDKPLHNRLRPYEFHHASWHYVTLLAPNLFGSYTPTHTRWAQVIPSDGRIWTPSLHVGGFVFLLAILCWKFQWRSSLAKLSMFVAGIAFLSSLGCGGLYDFWTTVIPGYSYFRYPAKWTIFFAWAICFAASIKDTRISPHSIGETEAKNSCIGLHECHNDKTFSSDHVWEEGREESIFSEGSGRILRLAFFGLGILGTFVLILHFAIVGSPQLAQSIYNVLARVQDDPWCGALDRQRAVQNLGWTGLLLVFVGFASSLVLLLSKKSAHRISRHVLVLISMAELASAAASQICFVHPDFHVSSEVNQSELKQPLLVSQIVEWHFGDSFQWVAKADELTPAVHQSNGNETEMDFTTRLEFLAVRQSNALLGKLHLLEGIRSFQAQFTFRPRMVSDVIAASPSAYWRHRILSESELQKQFVTEVTDDRSIEFRNVIMEGSHVAFDCQASNPLTLELPMMNDGGWRIDQAGSTFTPKMLASDVQKLTLLLASGKQTVSLYYWPPGLSIGILISISTVGLFFSMVCLFRPLDLKLLSARERIG